MANPKISVVMSVYNGQKYLKQAIDSILSQTYKDFEFLIVNDASTDDSLKIIEEYAKKDKRIKIIKNNKNIGLTESLIKAINLAKGKYISRQDADDVSLPQRLEKQLYFLEQNPSYGALGTSAQIIDKKGEIIKKASVPKSWFMIKQILKFGNCFVHGSMMFRKDVYKIAGGYRKLFILGQDFDLWLRMSKIKKMKNLKENLYLWRKTKSSLSSKKMDTQFKLGALALYEHRYKKNLELKENFEVNNFINKLNNKEREKYNTCLGDLYLRHGNIRMAEKYHDQGIFRYILRGIINTLRRT